MLLIIIICSIFGLLRRRAACGRPVKYCTCRNRVSARNSSNWKNLRATRPVPSQYVEDRSNSPKLRTRLTTLAQRARLVVIQDGDNVYIEDVVPVECPVRHGLGTVGFTDDHTPTTCQIMPAANLFDAAASVCGILLRPSS